MPKSKPLWFSFALWLAIEAAVFWVNAGIGWYEWQVPVVTLAAGAGIWAVLFRIWDK